MKCWLIHFVLHCTCFSQWQQYINREISDCTPHISLFRSLRMTAAAMQILGECDAPTLLWFLWSLWAASRSAAQASNLLTNSDHLKSIQWATSIFWNRDLFPSDRWHKLLHSLLMASKKVTSRTLSMAITALAIDRACPPSNCHVTFASLSPSALVHGVRLGVDTVTYYTHFVTCCISSCFCVSLQWHSFLVEGFCDVHCMYNF